MVGRGHLPPKLKTQSLKVDIFDMEYVLWLPQPPVLLSPKTSKYIG